MISDQNLLNWETSSEGWRPKLFKCISNFELCQANSQSHKSLIKSQNRKKKTGKCSGEVADFWPFPILLLYDIIATMKTKNSWLNLARQYFRFLCSGFVRHRVIWTQRNRKIASHNLSEFSKHFTFQLSTDWKQFAVQGFYHTFAMSVFGE